MRIHSPRLLLAPALILSMTLTLACGEKEETLPGGTATGTAKSRLSDLLGKPHDDAGVLAAPPREVVDRISTMSAVASAANATADLVVDYPLDESVFPPDFLAPTFLWHDPESRVDTWLVEIGFTAESAKPIRVLVPGAPPPKGEIDEEAVSSTNEIHLGTEYQQTAKSWTPSAALWEEVKRRSEKAPAAVTFTGWASGDLGAPLSSGSVRIVTSADPVGAPIFYRDVPLMPNEGEDGVISPLATNAAPIIAWRLRDVARPKSKLVLKGMGTCGNCHSFSLDGKRLGMDVDGPSGDKGMYALKDLSKKTVIGRDDVITWNSFKDKPEGHKTIGFLSRISPDGRTVISTVNEKLFVQNFTDHRFLQVFYPARGILAWYSEDTKEIRALPGADDPEFVHCDPVWSPDGKTVIFVRATATDPYSKERPSPRYANDPNELQLRFDLYRIPFNEGKGGTPVPVEGASDNGMSNTFPKVSPDGKWIVWVKCRNGQLMRPDGRLWIVPFEGGEPREMRCNTNLMNSWHSFSPNSRWMVFSSKINTPYTQAFLTHIDEEGNDSPAILVPNCTADNRAVNLPEFLNAPYDSLDSIVVPAVNHLELHQKGLQLKDDGKHGEAVEKFLAAVQEDPEFVRARLALGYSLLQLGRPEDAAPQFERALQLEPGNTFGLNQLANSYLKTGYAKRAIALYEQLIREDPESKELRTDLRTAETVLKALQERRAEVRKTLDAGKESAGLLTQLASLCDCLDEPGKTEEYLRRAADLEPDNPAALLRLAWIQATHRDIEFRDGAAAVRLAERAVTLTGGKDPLALDVLAAAQAEAGKYEEAAQAARRAIALAEKDSAVYARTLKDRLELYESGRPYHAGVDP